MRRALCTADRKTVSPYLPLRIDLRTVTASWSTRTRRLAERHRNMDVDGDIGVVVLQTIDMELLVKDLDELESPELRVHSEVTKSVDSSAEETNEDR